MKKLFYILFLTLYLTSCTVNKQPEFLGIEKIDLVNADIDSLTIEAHALFSNENDLGGTLEVNKIDVFIDDAFMATVSSESFNVPKQNTFKVPLRVNFPTSKILSNNKGNLLGALIKQVLNQKVEINMKGAITYKFAGFSFDYPIDHKEEILLD